MTKVNIWSTERWPDYFLEEEGIDDDSIEVNNATIKRWESAIGEYNKVQHEMEEIWLKESK